MSVFSIVGLAAFTENFIQQMENITSIVLGHAISKYGIIGEFYAALCNKPSFK